MRHLAAQGRAQQSIGYPKIEARGNSVQRGSGSSREPAVNKAGRLALTIANYGSERNRLARSRCRLPTGSNQAVQPFASQVVATESSITAGPAKDSGGVTVWHGHTDNYIQVAAASDRPQRNTITPVDLIELRSGRIWGRIRSGS